MSDESTTTAMDIAVADKIVSKDTEATTDIESQILTAMRNRVTYLRNKADSFTIESVRRLLEKDMELEIYDLDVHKSFIKQNLVQCLESSGVDETTENSQKTENRIDVTPAVNIAKLSKEDAKQHTTCDDDDEKTEDSPVMGLLTDENTSKSVAEGTKDEDSKEFLQSEIKRALRKRCSYIKANAEKVTLGVLRRLLEQDLKLEKYSLDPYKKYINDELDELLQAPKPSPKTQRKTKKAKSKTAKNSDSEESSDSDGEEDDEVAVKKKRAPKRKSPMSEGTGKRKRENEKVAFAKKTKQTDSLSESDAGDNPFSSEKSVKETATSVYGKRVEHLKSVIKSCGMSISPSVYRKAKQAPEEKREDTLIKELKEILSKEGLSSNPSENEIKEVKKRKQRSKELEGIDTSNIVSSVRRRSNTSFAPPPKPEKTEESESDESEDSENEDDEEVVVEEEEDDEKDGNEDGGEGSQSEEEPNTEDGDEDESE